MTKKTLLAFFIWFLAAAFFLYEFFLRVFVGTISDVVIADLNLTMQQFALLGAGYYITYSFMQLPVGILVDRYGSRILLSGAAFLTALGGFWFAFAHDFFSGFVSRCFMGFGSSFAYVCLLVLALNWFPRKHFGFMIGIANFLGATGPMLAGGPLAFLLTLFNNNWRLVLGGIGGIGFALTLLIALFVRNAPSREKGDIVLLDPSGERFIHRLFSLFKNPQVWGIVLYAGFIYVSLPLLGAYWGTAYLQEKGFDKVTAASMSSMLWVGLAVMSPVIGRFSDHIKRRKLPLMLSASLGVLATLGVLFWPSPNPWVFGTLFFCIGSASAGQIVSFATISEHVQRKLHATAIGFNNSIIMLFAALLPQVATFLIHTRGFTEGLVLMPIFFLLALLISLFFIKETYCRQQFEVIMTEGSSMR